MIFTEDRQDVGQKDTFGDLVRLLAFLVVCFLPFLQERAQYQYTIEREVLANQEVMTSPGYDTAQGVAKGFYNVVMTDLGVYRFLHVTLDNTKTPSDKFEAFWAKFLIVSERIVDNVPLLVYQIGWRLGVVGYWILYFIPFFGANIYSGVQHWKLSLAQASGAKIERFKVYRIVVRYSLFAFVLYLLIPSAGAATAAKYLVPGGLFVCAVMINKMVSAFHKMV